MADDETQEDKAKPTEHSVAAGGGSAGGSSAPASSGTIGGGSAGVPASSATDVDPIRVSATDLSEAAGFISKTQAGEAVAINDGSGNYVSEAMSDGQSSEFKSIAQDYTNAANANLQAAGSATNPSAKQVYESTAYGQNAEAAAFNSAASEWDTHVAATTTAAPVAAAPIAVTPTAATPAATTPVAITPVQPSATASAGTSNSDPVALVGTAISPTNTTSTSTGSTDTSTGSIQSSTTQDPVASTVGASTPTESSSSSYTSEQSSAPAAGSSTYTVNSGDTLTAIAEAHGVSLSSLEEANRANIPNPDLIYPGQNVYIPGGTAVTSSTSTLGGSTGTSDTSLSSVTSTIGNSAVSAKSPESEVLNPTSATGTSVEIKHNTSSHGV
jgi:LysM repeat protein